MTLIASSAETLRRTELIAILSRQSADLSRCLPIRDLFSPSDLSFIASSQRLCCGNWLIAEVSLSPESLIPRLL
jgi:hypothetical protein